MHEIDDQSRTVMIAAVFCAIVGLIAYAGYLQRGWALNAVTIDIHRAGMAGQKAPMDPRQARPDDRLRAVFATEYPDNP